MPPPAPLRAAPAWGGGGWVGGNPLWVYFHIGYRILDIDFVNIYILIYIYISIYIYIYIKHQNRTFEFHARRRALYKRNRNQMGQTKGPFDFLETSRNRI